MNNVPPNRLKDARATFNLDGATTGFSLGEGQTYRAKVFQSGNSLAVRLPKALGLAAGMEMELRVMPDGSYALCRPEAPRRKIDISGFAGKAPGIRLAPREDFEERPSTIAAKKAAGLL